MNIYVYDSSTINEYSVDDCGLISSSPMEVFDCGKINSEESPIHFENYNLISCKETLHPFGSIKVKQNTKTKYHKISVYFNIFENINKKSIILNGLIINWIGFGTLFELDNGLIRQVVPDVSGGGTIS